MVSAMIRRGNMPVWLLGALLCSLKCFAATAADDNVADPNPIPTTSIAVSDSCERIAAIQQELQGGFTGRQLQRIQGPEQGIPLGEGGKLRLALANFSDPLGIAATAADAGISTGTSDEKSAFGTGWPAFGRRFGMSMADTASGEFFSTFVVSTLFHQDPHYHRYPDAPTRKRIVYALSRVLISRSDSGKPMFNYAEFLGTAASSSFENSYHFERDTGPAATSQRIFVSIGSDAAWNLMTEFLPDMAKHINPRMIFLRRLAEKAAEQN
jgi:hypothetical protein